MLKKEFIFRCQRFTIHQYRKKLDIVKEMNITVPSNIQNEKKHGSLYIYNSNKLNTGIPLRPLSCGGQLRISNISQEEVFLPFLI